MEPLDAREQAPISSRDETATEHAASRATAEMHSRHRGSPARIEPPTPPAECEKLRAELRYADEKVSTSQKLDLPLERGRIRDELQSRESKTAQMEIRLDREISSMKTTIEAAKSDVIKHSLGAVSRPWPRAGMSTAMEAAAHVTD